MDCDYPVPDIYDDYIVDDGCYPCGPYTSNDEQEDDPNSTGDKRQANGYAVVETECKCPPRERLSKYSQSVIERKEKAVLRKLGAEEEENDNTKVEDCCTHGGKNESGNQHTFLLTFGSTDGDDDCKLDEKTRCKAFWKYVDSNELLQALVREGEFVYEHPPQQIQHKPMGNLTMRKNKQTLEEENFAYLAERNRAVREDEEKRFFKQRQKNLELQYKSGQISSLTKKKDATIKKGPKYADLCEPTISEVLREMKIFDSLTNNPVRVPETTSPDEN